MKDNSKTMASQDSTQSNPPEVQVKIQQQMQSAYLDYAMSVIIGRALPDVRDGLKPVHRRILFAMHERAWRHENPYVKCAKIVGEVIGNFHPHGDGAVYESLVRMAQLFSMNIPLIDGQGNFGSIDGDPPAAYRYTEARLMKITERLLNDIHMETVDFVPTFDDSRKEPVVLPAAYPNLFVNGSEGIAVGMSTNVPPHNFNEIVRATIELVKNPQISVKELMKYVPAPDFPTGGLIIGAKNLLNAYETGHGSISVRAQVDIGQSKKKRDMIVVHEIPYQVNKTDLLERIGQLVQNKKIVGIADIRDLSDRRGIRVEIELKKDAKTQVILNQLYKQTDLQRNYRISLLAIVDNQPKILNLKSGLEYYVAHRKEIIIRRTKYQLAEAQKRVHILEGFKKALDIIEQIIKLIRASDTVQMAREQLISTFDFSVEQATAILEMRLQKLTSLERKKILQELKELKAKILEYKKILKEEAKRNELIIEELQAASKENPVERKSELDYSEEDIGAFEETDLIANEEVVIRLSANDFIKRMNKDTFRRQKRGGRGVRSGGQDSIIKRLLVANTHDTLLMFSNRGKVFSMPVHELPDVTRDGRGKSLKSLINLSSGEMISVIQAYHKLEEGSALVMATRLGIIKKIQSSFFATIRRKGIIAIQLKDDNELVDVRMVDNRQDLILCSQGGYALRIKSSKLRNLGRTANGVIGMNLGKNDTLIGMDVIDADTSLFTISKLGYGKRVVYKHFGVKNRGGKGVSFTKISPRNGNPVRIASVRENDHIVLITDHGVTLRVEAKDISRLGRTALGVRIVNIDEDHAVSDIALLSGK